MFTFLPRFERLSAAVPVLLAVLMASLVCASGVRAQTPQGFPFRATYYEVEVLLHPEDQTISGQAKVEFIAQQPGRTVVVELHQDLRVTSVKLLNGEKLDPVITLPTMLIDKNNAADILKKNGVAFTEIQYPAFRKAMEPVYAMVQSKLGGDLLERVSRAANAARS